MNVKMEQKGQPYVSKFYQLSNITSSPIVHFFKHVYEFNALPNITIYKGYKIKYTQHLHILAS